MTKSKLRHNKYGLFYNYKKTTKRESERLHEGKTIATKNYSIEKQVNTYQIKKGNKTHFKKETVYVYKDESGNEISKKEFNRNESRKAQNEKVLQKNKEVNGGTDIEPEFEETYISTKTIFEDLFDSFEAGNTIYFNGKKVNNILNLDSIFKRIRAMLKGKSYPRFILKQTFSGVIKYSFIDELPDELDEE